MKTKLEMAHDYFMGCIGNSRVTLDSSNLNTIQENAWIYADAMHLEMQKRDDADREQKRKELKEALSGNGGFFLEVEGQHFDDVAGGDINEP